MNTNNKVRIFFPVDVSTEGEVRKTLDEVAPHIDVIKVGLELMYYIGAPRAIALAKDYAKEVMVDAKLIDIPNTVAGGAGGIFSHGVTYLNLMALNQKKAIEKAVKKVDALALDMAKFGIQRPKIIAVTALTSWTFEDFIDHGIIPPLDWKYPESDDEKQEFITHIALKWGQIAVDAGVDCLLASPKEIKAFKKAWPDIEFICPGIRAPWSEPDDQVRKMSPYEAVKAGGRNLVIGRPIRNPEGMTRQEAAQRIRDDIDRALAEL